MRKFGKESSTEMAGVISGTKKIKDSKGISEEMPAQCLRESSEVFKGNPE